MTACVLRYAYPTDGFTLRAGPASRPRIGPQGIPTAPAGSLRVGMVPGRFSKDRRRRPAARGHPLLPLEETPSGRSPWGHHTAGLELPRKAKRRPLSATTRTHPVPSQGRARGWGEGSVAIESQERPRDPPPAPSSSRPRPHLPLPAQSRPKPGARPAGRPPGREWSRACRPVRLRPRKPPIAGESRFPSRTGRTLARPARRGKLARPTGAPSLSIQEFPEKAWRDPRSAASHARGGRLQRVAPGPAGPRSWLRARRGAQKPSRRG